MKAKKLLRAFIFLFIISFLFVNWSQISWVFNYRVVSGLFSDSFSPKEKQTEQEAREPAVFNESDPVFYEEEDSLEIAKIDVFVPLILAQSSQIDELTKALDKGTVIFPDSVLPGQTGQTIILGHSAPPGWPKVKYDWVFTRINELSQEDEIVIYFNNGRFAYSVTNKFFLERGEEIPEYRANSENILILISCWPPGKDLRRIAVEAELK